MSMLEQFFSIKYADRNLKNHICSEPDIFSRLALNIFFNKFCNESNTYMDLLLEQKKRRGSVKRIKKAYEEYYQTVYGYLLGITAGNYELSEELTQETFYRATKNIGKFRGDCKMSTWLCQIAKYTYYQYLDKQKRRKEVPLEAAVDAVIDEEIERNYIDNEAKLTIYKKIQKLGSPMKDVFMLRLSGELSFKEIGDILGKSENWARVTYFRGKQILGKEMEQDGKEV